MKNLETFLTELSQNEMLAKALAAAVQSKKVDAFLKEHGVRLLAHGEKLLEVPAAFLQLEGDVLAHPLFELVHHPFINLSISLSR